MNREVHVRVWERAEVKFLRATRQKPALPRRSIGVRFALNKQTLTERVQCDAMCHNRPPASQQVRVAFIHVSLIRMVRVSP